MTFFDGFSYRRGVLYAGGVSLREIARRAGTPSYVYQLDAVVARYRAYEEAFAALPHRTCYAVKANSSLALLQALARAGCGFDANSRGELARVLRAGGDPATVTMTGVGKTAADVRDALTAGILLFNAESAEECRLLDTTAAGLGTVARVVLRVNPDVDVDTHPYIATGLAEHKFGLSVADARSALPAIAALPHVALAGFGMHLGSQIFDPAPYRDGVSRLLALARDFLPAFEPGGIFVNVGGGLGVPYREGDSSIDPAVLANAVEPELHAFSTDTSIAITVLSEPGRWLVANAGVLLARVEYIKRSGGRTFVILDAGMNDLIRPALYEAHHEIVPVAIREGAPVEVVDVAGPVCESGDTFATGRALPRLEPGDFVALCSAGAYGSTMSSTYNSRPLAPEIVVTAGESFIARERMTVEQMLENERLLE